MFSLVVKTQKISDLDNKNAYLVPPLCASCGREIEPGESLCKACEVLGHGCPPVSPDHEIRE